MECSSDAKAIGGGDEGVYTRDGSVDFHGRPAIACRTGKWKACAFLLGYEAFERMAFYGIASNLVVYLTSQLHEDTVSSVTNVNNWSGAVWMTPILGAYIADSYFGRFWTFTISALIYTTGMVLLTLAVSLKSLKPPTCTSCKATSSQIAFFYFSLYTIAIGAGGTKPNISTFGADQFDNFNPTENQLKTSFFNWWMFTSFFGGLIATLGLVYIQENVGWGLGYGIPTIGLALSLVLFYIGTPLYRHKSGMNLLRRKRSPAKDIYEVVVMSFVNWRVPIHELHEVDQEFYVVNGIKPAQHTPIFPFFDKAAAAAAVVKNSDGSSSSASVIKRRHSPCTVTQVEKTKVIYGMFLVWLTILVPSTINAQINTLFIKQGTTLDRHFPSSNFQIPAASLGSFVTLSMLISVPLYDRYFVPFMRGRTGNPRGISLLQRLGIGCVIQILAIVVACLIEIHRMRVIKEDEILTTTVTIPMSIFWLLPQYILLGIADVFSIGVLEFFYDQSPDDMQSLGTTFFTSSIGVGNFLSTLLIMILDKVTAATGKRWIGNNLNNSRLDYFYAFLSVLAALNFGVFLWVSNRYVYNKKMETSQQVCQVEEETTMTTTMTTRSFAGQQMTEFNKV